LLIELQSYTQGVNVMMRPTSESLPPSKLYLLDRDHATAELLCRYARRSGVDVARLRTSAEFVQACALERPSCLVISIEQPGDSELALLHSIRARHEPIEVIAVGATPTTSLVVRALREGVLDFFAKPLVERVLVEAVSTALEHARRRFGSRRRWAEFERRLAALTDRQREILHHIVLGKANKVIASDLGISERTVEVHRHQLLRRMSVGSAIELARLTGEFEAAHIAVPCLCREAAQRNGAIHQRPLGELTALAG